MMSAETIKQALSEKVRACQPESTSVELDVPAAAYQHEAAQTIGLTLTITLPAQQAGLLLSPITKFLVEMTTLPNGKQVGTSTSSREKDLPCPVDPRTERKAKASPPSQPHSASASTLMTPKQKGMIIALVSKKKLAPEQVESLLLANVGHTRETELTKQEASSLIGTLLAL